jgi:hypothetical protein
MDVPGIVRERLGDERRMTSVNIGGEDRVYVTPPRTLVYHASGLFSRESIDEYAHDARRFDVSANRREATFAFEYDDGVEAFSIPRERIETVLPPVLAGVLRTTGHIDDEESVEESYRFGERTVVVTEAQVLTSVGEAVWDHDHDSYAYEEITDLAFDDGDLVVVVDGRSRRIELDDDSGREAYETVEAALLAYHGVGSVDDIGRRSPERASTEESPATGGVSPVEDRTSDSTTDTAPATDTAPPTEPDDPNPEPLSGRADEATEPAGPIESAESTEPTGRPSEDVDRPPEAADQRSETDDRDGSTASANDTDSGIVSSPPPSSPAPGGPTTGPLIPDAPDSGTSRSEAGDDPAGTEEAPSAVDPATETESTAGSETTADTESTAGSDQATAVDSTTDADPTTAVDSTTDADPATNSDPAVDAERYGSDIADETPDLGAELDALRERVDQQSRLLERNRELLERLVETQESKRVSDDR